MDCVVCGVENEGVQNSVKTRVKHNSDAFSKMFIFFRNNKIDVFVVFLIVLLVHYMFLFGLFSFKKYKSDLTGVVAGCQYEYGVITFRSKDLGFFSTSKKFDNCFDVASKFKGRKIIALHSSGGIIGSLHVDDKKIFSTSSYIYILPYSIFLPALYVAMRRNFKRKKKQCDDWGQCKNSNEAKKL